uniref:Uncharacterized protein n=1 Tax=Trichogramma kaykai TaxID=54128 RepID=A0ABD2WLE5_9HYME
MCINQKINDDHQNVDRPSEGAANAAVLSVRHKYNQRHNKVKSKQSVLNARPRSLYTTLTCPEDQQQHIAPQAYPELGKQLEENSAYGIESHLGSQWRRKALISKESQFFSGLDNWSDAEAGLLATPHGTISLRLRNKIRVDLTVDRAVRLINWKNNIVLALSGSGTASALLHPNGRIYQYGSRVEILAHDFHGNDKYAKMWYKGVSFSSEQCALVYLVDAAGTRTTTDTFSDMRDDFSLPIFYAESRHGPAYYQQAAQVLSNSQYWQTNEGIENWIINNVRISQTPDGLVRIARNNNKYQLRTSPSNGTASLTTPFLHCTASLGQTSHLFVRRGERRMHYDGTSFIVRNAGHSAGFDNSNQLNVY